jgi:hypothetical protein
MTDSPPTKYSDSQALHLFVRRASRACAHPLAATDLNTQISLKVTEKDGQIVDLDLDLHNADEASWQGLALHVRPLVFLKGEKLKLTRIMALVGRLAPDLKEHSDDISTKFLRWKESVLFYSSVGEKLPPEEALPKGQYQVQQISHGDPAVLGPQFDTLPGRKVTDIEMAETVLYGELFHMDPEKALTLEDLGTMGRAFYAKAAEVRVRQACYFLRGGVHLIEHGWRENLLPRLDD